MKVRIKNIFIRSLKKMKVRIKNTSSRSLKRMKKVVVKLEVYDNKSKKKAMKIVSNISGVNSVSMDMKDTKLTVTGDVDAVVIVRTLRKICPTEIVAVEPGKKQEELKKEEKKEEPKNPDDKKKEDQVFEPVKLYKAYNPHLTRYDFVRSVEEEEEDEDDQPKDKDNEPKDKDDEPKDPDKKQEPKREEEPKEREKKEESKKPDGKKKQNRLVEITMSYLAYNPFMTQSQRYLPLFFLESF